MAGPIADFVCLGKKCRQDDGGAATYEDLPIATTRCPVCGSKRVQRLYNKAPGMTRSGMRPLQTVIDTAGQEAELVKHNRQDSANRLVKAGVRLFAVPLGRVAETVQRETQVMGAAGAVLGSGFVEGKGQPGVTRPAIPVLNRNPVPGEGSKMDKEWRVKITKSGRGGTVTAEKAG